MHIRETADATGGVQTDQFGSHKAVIPLVICGLDGKSAAGPETI